MASHDQKIHVAIHFDNPDITNAMVSLMMLFELCNTSANSVMLAKSHVAPHFNVIYCILNVMNAMVPLMMPSASHDMNGIT